MDHEMITVSEIAEYLRISLPSAYKLINSGSIPHVKIGCRYVIPRLVSSGGSIRIRKAVQHNEQAQI